jgi:hypothetical protein
MKVDRKFRSLLKPYPAISVGRCIENMTFVWTFNLGARLRYRCLSSAETEYRTLHRKVQSRNKAISILNIIHHTSQLLSHSTVRAHPEQFRLALSIQINSEGKVGVFEKLL